MSLAELGIIAALLGFGWPLLRRVIQIHDTVHGKDGTPGIEQRLAELHACVDRRLEAMHQENERLFQENEQAHRAIIEKLSGGKEAADAH